MGIIITGIVLVVVAVMVSLAGLYLVRRKVELALLETHHEVAGFFIGVLGGVYAVLLAFVVVVVWGQLRDAEEKVSQEANHINDLARLAGGFTEPVPGRIRAALQKYARTVTDKEWPAMARGEDIDPAQRGLDELWAVVMRIAPAGERENAIYAETLDRLSALSDTRRLRLHLSRQSLPAAMWIVLGACGFLTIAFTYFFGVHVRSQALMTAALTAEIALILFLILLFNHPFRTGFVKADMIRLVLTRIESQERSLSPGQSPPSFDTRTTTARPATR